MKKTTPREKWWLETREKVDLKQHAIGIGAALAYALLIILLAAIFAVVLSFWAPGRADAQEAPSELTTSKELIELATELDGQTVVYEGEAIGEALGRGDHAWVNVSDGSNAIGIWMRRSDADSIKRFGDYRNNGDRVRVTGVFHRADEEHGGDLDIQATKVSVLVEGTPREHPVAVAKIVAAAIALLLLAASFLFYRLRTSQRKPA